MFDAILRDIEQYDNANIIIRDIADCRIYGDFKWRVLMPIMFVHFLMLTKNISMAYKCVLLTRINQHGR